MADTAVAEPTPVPTKTALIVDGVLCVLGLGLLVMASVGNIDSYTGGAGAVALGAGIRGFVSRS